MGKESSKKRQRNSNIELLRIVSMFLIVLFLRGDGEPEGETFIACHAGGFLYFGVGDVV